MVGAVDGFATVKRARYSARIWEMKVVLLQIIIIISVIIAIVIINKTDKDDVARRRASSKMSFDLKTIQKQG